MIPDYQSLMLPLLIAIQDGQEYRMSDVVDRLADEFDLTREERTQLLPSGQDKVFKNRVGWAKFYLKKAGLIDSKRRGIFHISAQGKEVLSRRPGIIDNDFLMQFDDFVDFRTKRKDAPKQPTQNTRDQRELDPEEQLEAAYAKVHESLSDELLDALKQGSPSFFEQVVVDLLLKMGYGGSREDAGKAIGQRNDGGIDGIIKEDRLGLDFIYIQAKRWDNNSVGPGDVRDFAGALLGRKARRGVFITTSRFSKSAREYVSGIEHSIILIDGEELARLMIEFGVGVTTEKVLKVKKLDSDYFE